MKRRIISALVLLSLLFMLTAGLIIVGLLSTTAELRDIITLHQIDVTRQELGSSVGKIKGYVHGSPELFAEHLDEIIVAGNELDAIINNCHSCHHSPAVLAEIAHTGEMVAAFKEGLSGLITSAGEDLWRQRRQVEIDALGDNILRQVQSMLARTGGKIQQHTAIAMEHIHLAYWFLLLATGITLLLAILLGRWLLGRITAPIDRLHLAIKQIAAGQLGVRTEGEAVSEFAELIGTFNEMSTTLAEKERRIQESMHRLNELHKVMLPLHGAHDLAVIAQDLDGWLAALVVAEKRGILLRAGNDQAFHLHLYGTIGEAASVIEIPAPVVAACFQETGGKPLLTGDEEQSGWPFHGGEGAPGHGVAVWLVTEQRLEGALVVMNATAGPFKEEEIKILELLAKNLAVAMANIDLYRDLELKMEQLQKAQQQLIQAEKLTAVGTLAGGIAHDFNNILCGMLGHIALLKRMGGTIDQSARETLEVVEQAGFRAANLTKQLLTFSRQGVWKKQPVNLNEKIAAVVTLFEKTISRLIVIRTDLAGDLPVVPGDPGQIEQIIMNLCVNARDAMPAGGTLTISTMRHWQARADNELKAGEYARLSISDTGIGMEEATISRIFEPFFTTKELDKGTGLGLAMVYGIVSRHGGSCRVASSPGQGTTFTVYFPVNSSVHEEPLPEVRNVSGARHGVLIVDDEVSIAAMLERYLREESWTVYTAVNGEDAVKVLTAHQKEIDLVVLDVNMPVMGGEEAFHCLKAIKPELKVMVISGYNAQESVKKIIDAGADGFIQKPFRLEDLVARISDIFAEG